MSGLCAVVVTAGFEQRAEQLARQLQLPLIDTPCSDRAQKPSPHSATAFLCLLVVDGHGVGLQLTGNNAPGAVRCDFLSGAAAHRRRYGGGKKQDLPRAIGLDKRAALQVLDMTAGLGRDSFVLATQGAYVTLLERNPVVHALLADGLARAMAEADMELQDIIARMQLQSVDCLSQMGNWQCPQADVIYLDPMFPGRQKSAKVKKEMQAFHILVGDDPDADQLLPLAREYARYRVVVKRPANAPYLAMSEPDFSLTGKSTRYDIYTNRRLVD